MIASPSQTPSTHPEPSLAPTSGPSATSNPTPDLSFRPTGPKLEQLLGDLLNSYGSLHDVALNNDTTLAALTLWMAMPENQTLVDQVESAAYRRARLTASNVLADAVNSLSCSLRGHVEIETKHCAHLDYTKIRIYERARTNARKAAWLLYRISRSHPALPIDAATHLKLEEARLERARLKAASSGHLNDHPKAQLKDEPKAKPAAQPAATPTAQPAATTHAAPSPLHSPPQSTEQSPPESIAASNAVPDLDAASQSAPPSPSPASDTPCPSPSPRHSVTEPLPATESLRHSVTDTLSSVALRDLRGESSSSNARIPLDDHDTTLIPCGMTSDTS